MSATAPDSPSSNLAMCRLDYSLLVQVLGCHGASRGWNSIQPRSLGLVLLVFAQLGGDYLRTVRSRETSLPAGEGGVRAPI
jgi:hypothetical protein